MVKRTLRGHSERCAKYLEMGIPQYLVEEMDLHAGDEVTVTRVGKSIVITPVASRSGKNCDATEAATPASYGGINV